MRTARTEIEAETFARAVTLISHFQAGDRERREQARLDDLEAAFRLVEKHGLTADFVNEAHALWMGEAIRSCMRCLEKESEIAKRVLHLKDVPHLIRLDVRPGASISWEMIIRLLTPQFLPGTFARACDEAISALTERKRLGDPTTDDLLLAVLKRRAGIVPEGCPERDHLTFFLLLQRFGLVKRLCCNHCDTEFSPDEPDPTIECPKCGHERRLRGLE